MNPFDRFGIEHLSASSLNLYAEEPAYWTLVYLHRHKDQVGPAAWRGSAVEAGVDSWLYQRDLPLAIQIAHQRFEEDAQGDLDDKVDKERGLLVPMLEQAVSALHDKPTPIGRQIEIKHWFDGIEVPIIGYADYEFEDGGVDLKTTQRMPTEMPPKHCRQISLYQIARGKPYCGLYVTNKRNEIKYVDEAEKHVKRLEWYAHCVRRLISICPDKHDASRLFAPKLETFYWNSDSALQAAKEIWE